MSLNFQLSFENGETSLSVRRFSVHEEMSQPFNASVWARSQDPDLDLEPFVGRPASFAVNSSRPGPTGGLRRWQGVVAAMELVQAEPTGLSLYFLRIVPRLWLLTQNRNNRTFQHKTIPDMVGQLLDERRIKHQFRLDDSQYPRLEIRTQYGESDYDFITRLLQEAGISYSFSEIPDDESLLILHDNPQQRDPRPTPPIPHVDNPNPEAGLDYVTGVRLSQQVRPTKTTTFDHDFRRHPTYKLYGNGVLPGDQPTLDDELEIFSYEPGTSIVENPPAIKALSQQGATPPIKAQEGEKKEGDKKADKKGFLDAAIKVGKDKAQKKGIDKLGAKLDKAIDLPGSDGKVGKPVKETIGPMVQSYVDGKIEDAIGGAFKSVLGDKIGSAMSDLVGNLGGKIAGILAGEIAGSIAGTLAGDDKGEARHDEAAGQAKALRSLQAMRADRRSTTFETNALDLAPGVVIALDHPRSDLASDKTLLITESSMDGTHDGHWSMHATAAFTSVPHRPLMIAPKPKIQGMQSGVVVGPAGEEIYTDEFGRVRLQFHWDRQGKHDPDSFCWARVAQGWAGPGYGFLNIPRIGHEVLVSFLDGNPDTPVVVGRLFNATAPTPYPLPAHKTRSVWRSQSTPGGSGFNEIMLEDSRGAELLYVQAERDHIKLVKHDETESTGHDRTISVTNNRQTQIGANDESLIGQRHFIGMVPHGEDGLQTHWEMLDRRITFTTGEASLTLDGPNIYLMAKGNIKIKSTDDDVEIEGGPWVKINCDTQGDVDNDTFTMHHIAGTLRDQDGKPAPNLTVVVKDSEGTMQQVQTDEQGKYFALVMPGECEVSIGSYIFGTQDANYDHMGIAASRCNDYGPAL